MVTSFSSTFKLGTSFTGASVNFSLNRAVFDGYDLRYCWCRHFVGDILFLSTCRPIKYWRVTIVRTPSWISLSYLVWPTGVITHCSSVGFAIVVVTSFSFQRLSWTSFIGASVGFSLTGPVPTVTSRPLESSLLRKFLASLLCHLPCTDGGDGLYARHLDQLELSWFGQLRYHLYSFSSVGLRHRCATSFSSTLSQLIYWSVCWFANGLPWAWFL